ncbi:hypothetical protein EDD18DRAFT_1195241 [Armillaria luteobubalina]|uniref:Secreted protein n=1 Tax=Armillaria luteobubalina TaxID=153913 RepID=A0AA39PJX5_9AGAR|nr:hypothetical protein EDD18DRAFT_1195241 [Armillaria luteobubalina]
MKGEFTRLIPVSVLLSVSVAKICYYNPHPSITIFYVQCHASLTPRSDTGNRTLRMRMLLVTPIQLGGNYG